MSLIAERARALMEKKGIKRPEEAPPQKPAQEQAQPAPSKELTSPTTQGGPMTPLKEMLTERGREIRQREEQKEQATRDKEDLRRGLIELAQEEGIPLTWSAPSAPAQPAERPPAPTAKLSSVRDVIAEAKQHKGPAIWFGLFWGTVVFAGLLVTKEIMETAFGRLPEGVGAVVAWAMLGTSVVSGIIVYRGWRKKKGSGSQS